MSNMKCPICGEMLQKYGEVDPDTGTSIVLGANCPKCGIGDSDIKLWQELIRTRKELDIRKKQVEIANKAFDFINTEWDNIDCSRKELGACAFNAKEDIAGWESDIETALEQKDVK